MQKVLNLRRRKLKKMPDNSCWVEERKEEIEEKDEQVLKEKSQEKNTK